MALVQVRDGQVVAAVLPVNGILTDGRSVSNYLALPADVLAAEGWVQTTDVLPVYDPAIEHLVLDRYEVDGGTVTAVYRAEPSPQEPEPEPVPPTRAEFDAIVDAVEMLTLNQLGG